MECREHVRGLSTCFSDCGTFINVQRDPEFEHARTIVWHLPDYSDVTCKHLRAVLKQRIPPTLPRTIQPHQLVHSTYWGSDTTFLKFYSKEGRFKVDVYDPQHPGFTFMVVAIPTYLAKTVPTVCIDDNDGSRSLTLVFLCKDRCPELLVLPFFRWNSLIDEIKTNYHNEQQSRIADHNAGSTNSINETHLDDCEPPGSSASRNSSSAVIS